MSVFDRLVVRGRAVFKMNSAAETQTVTIPDGTLRLYTDAATGRQYIQTFSRSVGPAGAWETFAPAAALPPADADYLVGTSNVGLTSEIAVGTTPGGELGGTWAMPTVDATHSGSSHSGVVATHEAAGNHVTNGDSHDHLGGDGAQIDHGNIAGLGDDDHAQYLNSARHTALSGDHVTNGDSHNHNGGDGGQIDHGALGGRSDDDHSQYLTVGRHDADDHSGLSASDLPDHASRHERGGADEIDGDHLDIDFTPSNYTPSTTPAEAAHADDLSSHLYGIDQALGDSVPAGVIAMWSGTLATIPTGWSLCDGTSGTPDLRSRFVKGTAAAVNPGGTGGSATHQHTDHTITFVNSGGFTAASANSHTAVNHEPPYYEVAYIMKD